MADITGKVDSQKQEHYNMIVISIILGVALMMICGIYHMWSEKRQTVYEQIMAPSSFHMKVNCERSLEPSSGGIGGGLGLDDGTSR